MRVAIVLCCLALLTAACCCDERPYPPCGPCPSPGPSPGPGPGPQPVPGVCAADKTPCGKLCWPSYRPIGKRLSARQMLDHMEAVCEKNSKDPKQDVLAWTAAVGCVQNARTHGTECIQWSCGTYYDKVAQAYPYADDDPKTPDNADRM